MTWILRISSRIFSRFDLWTQVVFALSRIRPSTRLDENFRLRFAYACLMGRDRPRIRRAFAGMLRVSGDVSCGTVIHHFHPQGQGIEELKKRLFSE